MVRVLVACAALLLCGFGEPDVPSPNADVPLAAPDCRAPALYGAFADGVVSIEARRVSWSGPRLFLSFVLRNVSSDFVVINGPAAGGLILTEFELISPEGPRYYADWRKIKGVFRREGFPPLAPDAVAESSIQFEAQRRFYTLHFHQQLTAGGTKLRRSAFVCAIPG